MFIVKYQNYDFNLYINKGLIFELQPNGDYICIKIYDNVNLFYSWLHPDLSKNYNKRWQKVAGYDTYINEELFKLLSLESQKAIIYDIDLFEDPYLFFSRYNSAVE